MPELLTPARMAILTGLLEAGKEGLRLSEIADRAGITGPTAHKHLELLIDQGLAESTADQPGRTRYLARDFFRAIWIDRDHRILASWRSGSIDWRFPLVSQVPDDAARRVLTRYLEAAMFRGLFHPWLLVDDLPRPTSAHERKEAHADGSSASEHGVTVVVYGSCARGDAGASSDVDVLVIASPHAASSNLSEHLEDLAAEVNLRAERRIELKVIDRREFVDLPETMQRHIFEEGLPVYSTFHGGEFLDTLLAQEGAVEPR